MFNIKKFMVKEIINNNLGKKVIVKKFSKKEKKLTSSSFVKSGNIGQVATYNQLNKLKYKKIFQLYCNKDKFLSI